MKPANNPSRLKFSFLPVLLVLILFSVSAAFASERITTLYLDGKNVTDITRVSVRKDGKITIYSGSVRHIVDPDKLPPNFLPSWGIETNTIAATIQEANIKGFEKALAAGKFRVVDGVVYDLRQNNPEWLLYVDVKLMLKLSDDQAIMDMYPERSNSVTVDVMHFSAAVPWRGEDRFKFVAMRTGSAKFKTKDGEVVTIPVYDLGRPAERSELPDAILKDGKPFAPLVGSEAPSPSSLANLPQAEKLYDCGTAFFISDDGYLITNDHVVRGVHKVRVKTKDKFFDAKVVKTDQKLDLALLKIEGNSFTPLTLAGTKEPELGADVFTIGFPNPDYQGFEAKYTDGKISSLAGLHDDPSRFQISVPVQPGNSGGPLLNRYGAVNGVVVGRLDDVTMLVDSGAVPQNVNYAIKTSTLREFLKSIHELDGKLKSQAGSRKHADVLKRAQGAVVMVLGYK